MFTVTSRVGLIVVLIAAGAALAAPAPGTQPAGTRPAVAVATAPASQPGLLRLEPQPGGGSLSAEDFQGLGNIRVPAKKPAIARSDKPALWHDTNTRYRSALLFDESGGTGTGYDTLYVSLDGDETFAGDVATYKPTTTDVSPETLGRNFEMDFENVTIAQASNRPNTAAKITFRGYRNLDDPESQYSLNGRLYPPVPHRRWAVGTLVIDGKTVRVAIMDENNNGKFDDRGGLNPQNPESPTAGDVLLLAMTDDVQLNPRAYGSSYTRYAQRVPLPEYLVVNSGTFRVKIEQSEAAVSVELVPAELPAGTVELSENRREDAVTLTGTKTYVMLTDVPNKILLPADTYTSPYSGESPYEVEAEEGVTMGLPFPKGQEIAIPVRLPDGKPAAGADYLVLKTRNYVQITDGYFDPRRGSNPKKLGEDGVITVRGDIDNYDVIIVHDAGWAQTAKKEVEAGKGITLEPWGRVEGTVRVGSKIGSRQQVALIYRDFRVSQVDYTYTATADEGGRFTIDRVVPRKLEAGRKATSHNMGTTTTSMTYVKVEPGKTAQAIIGGTGRPVIGRLLLPEYAQVRAKGGWTFGNLTLPRDRLPVPTYPQNWMDMDEQQQQDWWKEQRAALQNVLEKMTTPERPANFQLEPDFSFRIEDVPAGTYMLEVQVAEAPSGSRLETIGTLRQKIDVPPMQDGRSDEPLDLGEIPLPIEMKAKIGETAPLFEVKDVWGKPMRIVDYQGKYLVLSFLWPGKGKTYVEQVKALHEEMSTSDRAAMVSVYPDRAPENVAEYFRSRQMTWPQAFVNYLEYPAGMRGYEIDYPATFFLIDPQGRIVAREMKFEGIQAALTKALAGELDASKIAPAEKPVATQPSAATQESAAADPSVLQAAQAFWKTIAAGEDDKAAGLCTPAYVQGHPQAFAKLREVTDPSAARIGSVATGTDRAIALTSELSFQGGRKGFIGIGLVRQGDKWLVRDLDFLPHEEARSKFVADFRDLTPGAGDLASVPQAAATQETSTAVEPPRSEPKASKRAAEPVATVTTPAAPAPAAVAKVKAEKPSLSAFTYNVPEIPKDSKVNLLFQRLPAQFAEEHCDQRLVPWKAAVPRPDFCKSDKALRWEPQLNIFPIQMMLDESGGTGGGYDTLYVDANNDSDLTNDPVYKASKFAGETGVEGGKVLACFENVVLPASTAEGASTVHAQIFLQEGRPGVADAEPLEGWAIPQHWAVGTAAIGNKTYPVAVLDRNWNDKLTDTSGFVPEQYPARIGRGDYLVVGKAGEKVLEAGDLASEKASARVIRTPCVVVDGAAYQTAVEQTADGASLRFEPAKVATGKVRFNAVPARRLVLLGSRTCAILHNPAAEFALPADTYLALLGDMEQPTIFRVQPDETARVTLAISTAAGQAAAPFDLQTLDGKPLKLEDYRGRHVVLSFWASWAKPCQADLPYLKSLHERFGKAGKVAVISLSMDDDADATRDFLERTPLPWPQGHLDDARRAEVTGAYGVESVPATFLIDPQGRIVAKDLRGPAIEAAVSKTLAGSQ